MDEDPRLFEGGVEGALTKFGMPSGASFGLMNFTCCFLEGAKGFGVVESIYPGAGSDFGRSEDGPGKAEERRGGVVGA